MISNENVCCKILIEDLKEELFIIKHEIQDEFYLDVEDIRKEVDVEFIEDVRD